MQEQIETCEQDNKGRLKKVKNLEDLISFKVSTVGKGIAPEESNFMSGLITGQDR